MGLSDCYFIWGEEDYLIDKEINKILLNIEKEAGEEPERISLDPDELSALELLQTLEFSPLFSTTRVIIIRKPLWLGKLNRKVKKMEEASQVIKDYLQAACQGQTLILTSSEHNATNPLVKILDRRAQVITCPSPDGKYLTAWIKAELKEHEREAKPAAISLLARSGQDMYYLKNLIDKVCLMIDSRVINENDFADQLENKHQINVFKLTDALLNRQLPASLLAYNKLLTQGEHPVLILNMIVRQFTILGKVKGYLQKGCSKKQIEELTQQKEFVVRKMMEKSNNFSLAEIRELFRRFLETDIAFKTTGKNERILTEELIIDICSKK